MKRTTMTLLTRTLLTRSQSQQLALHEQADWRRRMKTLPQPLGQIAHLLTEGWSEREIAVLLNENRGFIARSRVQLSREAVFH